MALIDEFALKVDSALHAKDFAKLNEAIEDLKKVDLNTLKPIDQASVHYFMANAYSGLISTPITSTLVDSFQIYKEKEIFHLRFALNLLSNISLKNIGTDLKLRITTNLANTLYSTGRFVEAIELWDKVLITSPGFSMAVANKALTLFNYARYAQTSHTQGLFLKESYELFKLALELGVESQAHNEMTSMVAHLQSLTDWEKVKIELPKYRKGRSKNEKKYRKWCIKNNLFLDLLNDISQDWPALEDTLTLPNMTMEVNEGGPDLPAPYSIFNQLKQEYVSARFLMFEAIQEQDMPLHYSDRKVLLYDALDYRYYRLWIEKLKMSFLAVFAIFDKIAYLINDYWKLSANVKYLSFQTIWFEDSRKKSIIRHQFITSDNKSLLGLFWLSKDLYFQKDSSEFINPEAKTLSDIRNHIAHKYLRVHDHHLYNPANERTAKGHDLSFPISNIELVDQSLKLLKLVRSALIYITNAMTYEESKRSTNSNYTFPMEITSVEDQYRL